MEVPAHILGLGPNAESTILALLRAMAAKIEELEAQIAALQPVNA